MVQPPALLLLGRLDGRLHTSPATDIWLANARISGASRLAELAGVPITTHALTDWICGRTPPPRHSEGLNDPLSVAALFHFALRAQDTSRDAVATATLAALRTLLDDRTEAIAWAQEDLVRFGPAFRTAQVALSAPYPAPTLHAVAERLLETHMALSGASAEEMTITTLDGRQIALDPRGASTVWLLACHLPRALVAAGLTLRALPTLVALPRFIRGGVDALADALSSSIGLAVRDGLKDLDRFEARVASLPADLAVTRRSRLPTLMRLEMAYPGLRVPAVARLLGISHQGATKLVQRARSLQTGLAS